MRRVLKLAQKGQGKVHTNPVVGAVIADRDGNVISEGYHSYFGGPHAEVAAIEAGKNGDIHGSTLYVNLEPCCFQGKTPPCTIAIINAGIKRVVAATADPDPRVKGKGFDVLKNAGIKVEVGVLVEKARYLNRGYFSSRQRGRAWCAVKVALSMDGKMAAADGQSKWITGLEARKLAHSMRADHDGILVGGGTVRQDDPELTVRNVSGSNPVRVIISPHYGIPKESKLAQTTKTVKTILVTFESVDAPVDDIAGIELLKLPDRGDGTIDPKELLESLLEFGVQSLLIEGGSGVLSSFMQADVIDEISVMVAPSVIGQGLSPFNGFIPESWEERPKFEVSMVKRYGKDVMIRFSR